MSLATRCPACGTVFRVVQDQLKVSGGWVRCGQCHEVFNGLQTLFELPPDPPATAPSPSPGASWGAPQEASPSPASAETWEGVEPQAQHDHPPVDEAPTVDLADTPPESEGLPEPEAPVAPEPHADVWAYTPRLADDDASQAERPEPQAAADPAPPETTPDPLPDQLPDPVPDPEEPPPSAAAGDATEQPLLADLSAEPEPAAPNDQPDGTPALSDALPAEPDAPVDAGGPPPPKQGRSKRQRKPAFMRKAERAARWRSPAVRAVLGSASAVLGLMLALQVVHHFRDDLAARWPATRGALTTWCQVANCQLKAPRALASITLESTALSRTSRPQVLRFEAELRNAASHAVMAPALDVSFTDNLGHQLVRKVLLPDQLGASPDGLAPNQSWHIEVPLQVGELPIAGFTAEVFYP